MTDQRNETLLVPCALADDQRRCLTRRVLRRRRARLRHVAQILARKRRVGLGTSVANVLPGVTLQAVGTITTGQNVVTGPAQELIVARFAEEFVVAGIATQRVVAVATALAVVSGTARERVVPGVSRD